MVENNCLREELCVMGRYRSARTDAALKHIGWSTKSTFCKFYEKPIVDIDLFQNALLK